MSSLKRRADFCCRSCRSCSWGTWLWKALFFLFISFLFAATTFLILISSWHLTSLSPSLSPSLKGPWPLTSLWRYILPSSPHLLTCNLAALCSPHLTSISTYSKRTFFISGNSGNKNKATAIATTVQHLLLHHLLLLPFDPLLFTNQAPLIFSAAVFLQSLESILFFPVTICDLLLFSQLSFLL